MPYVPLRWLAALGVGVVLVAVVIVARLLTVEDHGRTCPDAVDLSQRTVMGADLSQRRVPCLNLERATITGPVYEANLSRANLYRANLRSLWLEHVDLSGADLRGAAAGSANLSGVQLRRADLREAVLTRTRLENVGLQGAQLREADLRKAWFTRSDLAGVDARGADLSGVSLFDSNLRGARLDEAKLTDVVWSNVVCPDGTKSTETAQGSCERHLAPAR